MIIMMRKRKRQDSEGSEDLDEDLGSEGSAASPKHGQIAGTVDSYRVADLRDELRRRKQPTTGSKPNLFRRLLGYITPSKIWPVQYNYPGAADQVPLVTIAAVAQNGGVLKHASAELQGDREVVLAAVAQNGLALEDASARMRRNEGIVRAAMAQDPAAEKFAPGGSLAAVQAAAAAGARALGIWRGAPAAAAAVAARPPLLELDGEVLLHIVSVGGFGSQMLSPLACTCTRLRDQAEMMSMQLVGQRPDQGRAPRQAGQRWLAALRALEELERELGAYVSPHHEAFVVAVSKGGGKAGRRRFRLWREMNGLDDAQDETQWKPRHARAGGAPAHNWLTAALVVVAQERPKLEAAVGAEEAQRFVEGIKAELKGMLAVLGDFHHAVLG
jgi:hypothetical protein